MERASDREQRILLSRWSVKKTPQVRCQSIVMFCFDHFPSVPVPQLCFGRRHTLFLTSVVLHADCMDIAQCLTDLTSRVKDCRFDSRIVCQKRLSQSCVSEFLIACQEKIKDLAKACLEDELGKECSYPRGSSGEGTNCHILYLMKSRVVNFRH